jgi:hypothetical protein
MAERLESITYLDGNDIKNRATEFTTTPTGVVVEVGGASEVFIPWSRVLEYMGAPRGSWVAHHEPR